MKNHGTQGRIQACWLLFSPFSWQDVDLNHMVRPATYIHSTGLFVISLLQEINTVHTCLALIKIFLAEAQG